jgi:alpha-galactosidase
MGAGSAVFSRQLMMDILLIPDLDGGSFALVDIDPLRLEMTQKLAEKVIALTGKNWTVEASTDRRKVMGGSDYIINFIEVNGLQTVQLDHEIPMKYGIKQCIGDTIGPGGIFKALRTGPDWLDILYDAEELCPDALVLNYTNPMSILTLAALRATGMQVVGLCHSVQATSEQLAGYAEVPHEEMQWLCAGINHAAWFTELTHDGEDLYPLLKERARESAFFDRDPVRFEVMLQLGYFVTESSGHFSEYLPYFRKRDDLIERFDRGGYRGQTGFYAQSAADDPRSGQDRATPQSRIRFLHHRGQGDRRASPDSRQRAQHRSHRESASGRLRGSGLPDRRERVQPLPFWLPSHAAGRAEPDPHGRARIGGHQLAGR